VALAGTLLVGFNGAARGLAKSPSKNQLESAANKQKLVKIRSLRRQIDENRKVTWRWQDTVLTARTPSRFKERQVTGIAYLRWLHKLWAQRRQAAIRRAKYPPHLMLWLCIKSGIRGGRWDWLVHRRGGVKVGEGEASWFDDESPYWGGLQMGRWFQETYGGELYHRLGTANRWQPIQQIWVAERAFRSEGYSVRWLLGQWPNTAPPCISLLE
jgi:hypothetical protein